MITPVMETDLAADALVGTLLMLQAFGRAGEYVAGNAMHVVDPIERLTYLDDSIQWLREKAAEVGKWRELPVDFRTFVESDALLKKRTIMWPRVIECGIEMNSGRYVEAVLTGGIGVGKTHLAIYSIAYQTYLLSCLFEPHRQFDLDPSSEILMVFQSINANLAMDVDYRRFRDVIDRAPYFRNRFPYDRRRQSEMRFSRDNIVVKPVSGHEAAAIGQNVIGGILDEVNFMAVVEDSKHKRDGSVYDQAAENYNSIARRRESRFMVKGTLPGLLCLVSSANYPDGLTDRKRAEARIKPTIYVYDKRAWELRPERYGLERFRVFVGDSTRHPRIMAEEDTVVIDDEPLVLEVPTEHRHEFETNIVKAVRDIGGFSTQALFPFMLNAEAVGRCFGVVKSIGSRNDIDFKNTELRIQPEFITHRGEPRYIHCDLARTKDSAGFAMGYVERFVEMDRGDFKEKLPLITFDLVLEIMPPPGGEIIYSNIRKLIYDLRDVVGLPVKWVSFDQYQSAELATNPARQRLHLRPLVDGRRHLRL